ncbi:MAG: phage terminase large subunit [Candidatus Peribacteraceae bacterium]|nr:phage terminase large subunit [Candidatus Peribacteraceae bacterium]
MAEIDLRVTDKIAWLLSKPKRIKIAVGSRGSAKSIGVGDLMLMMIDSGRTVCFAREFQNSIDDSVHETLKQEIDRLGVEGFTVLRDEIRGPRGGRGFYKGLARNITSLKSLAGVDYLHIEEGESVSDKSLRVLTPSIRSGAGKEDVPEIWITMNRGSSADAIAKKYLKRAERELAKTGYYEDDMLMIVEVNYQDNPWFPPELEQERLDDLENLSTAEYDHVWSGKYNDTVDHAIITAGWFDAAIDCHKLDRLKSVMRTVGPVVVTFDPSDQGADAKGLCVRHGPIIKSVLEKTSGDVAEGCDWATDNAVTFNADWFVWDSDGLGTGLKRQVALAFDQTKIKYSMFKGSLSGKGQDNAGKQYLPGKDDSSAKKTYAQTFKNNRSQYYMELATRFHNTYRCVVKNEYVDPDLMISLDSDGIEDMEALRAEVCRIPLKPNPVGLLQIMSKQDMLKIDIPSPNMADSLMMSMWTPPLDEAIKLTFDSEW